MNAAEKKHYFTVEEANRRLPLVRAIVGDIVRLYHEIHDRRQRLARIRQLPGANRRDEDNLYSQELHQIEDEIDKDITRLQGFVDELGELGAELKDPVIGLIDFLSRIDGRDVYLCWKLGEDEIAYWHELDAGVQGRQSLFEKMTTGDLKIDEETE